jgi:hypothetical protein
MLSAKAAQVMLATGNDKLSNSTKCLEETRCKIQNLKRKLENFERPSQKEPAAKSQSSNRK